MNEQPELNESYDSWWPQIRRLWTVIAHPYAERMQSVSGSIFIRHVDGGSSNGPEIALAALTTPVYDLPQYGCTFVATPRHADLLLVSGPFVRSMVGPALAAFRVMPARRRVITIGEGFLGIDEGIFFRDSYALAPLPAEMLAAHVTHVSGTPPSPTAILKASWK